MSIITIIAKPPITVAACFKLHQLLQRSVAQIRSSVKSGVPIFIEELFDNDYERKSQLLIKLLEIADEESIYLELFETSSSVELSHYKTPLSKEVLINIINTKD